MANILIVDDDPDFGRLLQLALQRRDHTVIAIEHAEDAPERLAEVDTDLVLLDNRMPGMSGIDFLQILQDRDSHVPVILMTSHGTMDTAIQATNLGAFDYIIKPLKVDDFLEELEPLIAQAVDLSRAGKQRVRLAGDQQAADDEGLLILGNSKPMQNVYKLIGKVATSNTPVLIRGETGSGKELVARAVHAHSARKSKPFVAINCTALNEHLLDDELFGHEPGAFTGASKMRKGRFEYASGGTLFLDEVGDMPIALQAKLLRVLETQEVSRIGSNESIKVNVRLVSATHRDLEAAIAKGDFREDLFYRLNGVTVCLPPLRERGEDIRLLAEFFLAQDAKQTGRKPPAVHPSTWDKLSSYHWPGNVRQLQNVMRRALLICRGQVMSADVDFGAVDRAGDGSPLTGEDAATAGIQSAVRWALASGRTNLYSLLHDILERELLRIALEELDGNQTQVARRLGLARNTVHSRIQSYGLDS